MTKDPVTFKIGDDPQVYSLTYDFNQIVDAEETAGCNLFRAMGGSMTAKEFRALLYAFLKTAHPDVLLKEAGDLLTRDRDTVMLAVGKVLAGTEEEAPAETPEEVAA